jgi:predicted ATPase
MINLKIPNFTRDEYIAYWVKLNCCTDNQSGIILKGLNGTMVPMDYEGIVVIIGENGSGKTKLLEAMRDYYIGKNENVVYFPYERTLDITYTQYKEAVEKLDTLEVMNKLSENGLNLNLVKKWNLENIQEFDFIIAQDRYIQSGTMQAANFLTKITLAKEKSIVMIDFPEISLDCMKKRSFIDDIWNIPNIGQLIIVTHCPEIVSNHRDEIWEIEQLCDIHSK